MLGLVKDLVRQSKIIHYEDGRTCTPPEDRKVGEWDGNSVPISPELLDTSPVLELLIAGDDPSRTDPRNPDVDLDFTLPLPKADIAHLKPSDDGFHEPDGDKPPPPPLTPYQRAYLRAGIGAPTISGKIVSGIIPHAGRLTIQQANAMAPLHIADPLTHNPDATSAERGTSYVSKHHSKMERAVVNTIGRLSQWKHMLNPRSPFTSQPLKIIGQMPRGSVFKRNAAITSGALVSGSFSKLPSGSVPTNVRRFPWIEAKMKRPLWTMERTKYLLSTCMLRSLMRKMRRHPRKKLMSGPSPGRHLRCEGEAHRDETQVNTLPGIISFAS
jgi:hypothetical protein